MSAITRNPTANQTPDPGQGGGSVTSPINTGHGNTTLTVDDGASATATCIWTGFASAGGQVLSATLKVGWSQNGSLTGAGSKNNRFRVEYSLNNGSSWNTLFDRTGITSSSSGTDSASLPVGQNLTLVRVRDFLSASTSVVGTHADITASTSSIRIEAVTAEAALPVVIM